MHDKALILRQRNGMSVRHHNSVCRARHVEDLVAAMVGHEGGDADQRLDRRSRPQGDLADRRQVQDDAGGHDGIYAGRPAAAQDARIELDRGQ